MIAVITGASGFVGSNLCQFLDTKNNEVHKLSLRNKDWSLNIPVDSQAIIHLAGKAHDTANTSDASAYFKVNTELTKNLFDFYLNSEIQDFIYFSSVKAVADTVDGTLTEDVIGSPKTPYGESKLLAEEYILEQKLPQDKRVFIIRPCMIHGPGNKGNLNLLYNIVKKGIPYPLASFENHRSFLSIDNLNFMINAILSDKNILSGVYNFADDDAISTNRLVEIIAEVSGKKAHLLKIPKVLITTGAKIGDKIKLPLNSETVKKLTENYRVSNDKIKKAIGIENLPISTSEGLKKTIKSFMK